MALLAGFVTVGAIAFPEVDTAAASPAQDPSTETTAVDDPAVEPVTSTTAPEAGAGSRRVADENRKIWVVVAGLVVVAVVLSLLTIRYWRQTRPVRPATPEPDPDPDPEPEPEPEPTRVPKRVPATEAAPTPGPVPPLAPATEATPEPETEPGLAPTPAPGRLARGSERDGDGPGRHSRRAVAGADHATADDEWEPRGTGEHDRVVVPTAERVPRPDRSQRVAAYEAAGRSS